MGMRLTKRDHYTASRDAREERLRRLFTQVNFQIVSKGQDGKLNGSEGNVKSRLRQFQQQLPHKDRQAKQYPQNMMLFVEDEWEEDMDNGDEDDESGPSKEPSGDSKGGRIDDSNAVGGRTGGTMAKKELDGEDEEEDVSDAEEEERLAANVKNKPVHEAPPDDSIPFETLQRVVNEIRSGDKKKAAQEVRRVAASPLSSTSPSDVSLAGSSDYLEDSDEEDEEEGDQTSKDATSDTGSLMSQDSKGFSKLEDFKVLPTKSRRGNALAQYVQTIVELYLIRLNDFVATSRFHEQVGDLKTLQHQNLVPIRAIASKKANIFIVGVDHIEDSLYELLCKNVKLPTPLVARFALQVMLAITYLHRNGKGHFDLQSWNVLVDRSEPRNAKVLDVGLGRAMQGPLCRSKYNVMPPEIPTVAGQRMPTRNKDQQLTVAADIFNFGFLLWEMLAGTTHTRYTFCRESTNDGKGEEDQEQERDEEEDDDEILSKPMMKPPLEMVPMEFRSLLAECWDDDPSKRPTGENVLGQLKAIIMVAKQAELGGPPPLVHRNGENGIAAKKSEELRQNGIECMGAVAKLLALDDFFTFNPAKSSLHSFLETSKSKFIQFRDEAVIDCSNLSNIRFFSIQETSLDTPDLEESMSKASSLLAGRPGLLLPEATVIKDECESKQYVLFDYMNGSSLLRLLDKQPEGHASEAFLAHMAYNMLLSLVSLHRLNTCHGILSLKYVWIDRDSNVRVSGMEYAFCRPDIKKSLWRKETGLYGFAAPEVRTGEDGACSTSSDIWSVGMCLWAVCSGTYPLKGVNQVPSESDSEIGQLGLDKAKVMVNPTFHDFISKCLVEDPHARPSCETLLQHPFLQRYFDFDAKTPKSISKFERLERFILRKEIDQICKFSFPVMSSSLVPLNDEGKGPAAILDLTCAFEEDYIVSYFARAMNELKQKQKNAHEMLTQDQLLGHLDSLEQYIWSRESSPLIYCGHSETNDQVQALLEKYGTYTLLLSGDDENEKKEEGEVDQEDEDGDLQMALLKSTIPKLFIIDPKKDQIPFQAFVGLVCALSAKETHGRTDFACFISLGDEKLKRNHLLCSYYVHHLIHARKGAKALFEETDPLRLQYLSACVSISSKRDYDMECKYHIYLGCPTSSHDDILSQAIIGWHVSKPEDMLLAYARYDKSKDLTSHMKRVVRLELLSKVLFYMLPPGATEYDVLLRALANCMCGKHVIVVMQSTADAYPDPNIAQARRVFLEYVEPFLNETVFIYDFNALDDAMEQAIDIVTAEKDEDVLLGAGLDLQLEQKHDNNMPDLVEKAKQPSVIKPIYSIQDIFNDSKVPGDVESTIPKHMKVYPSQSTLGPLRQLRQDLESIFNK